VKEARRSSGKQKKKQGAKSHGQKESTVPLAADMLRSDKGGDRSSRLMGGGAGERKKKRGKTERKGLTERTKGRSSEGAMDSRKKKGATRGGEGLNGRCQREDKKNKKEKKREQKKKGEMNVFPTVDDRVQERKAHA